MDKLNKITLAALIIIFGALGIAQPIASGEFTDFNAFALIVFIVGIIQLIYYKNYDS